MVTSSAAPAVAADGGFVHSALIVESEATLYRRLLPALRRCLAAGEPVYLVVSGRTEQAVRAGLGERADDLEWGVPGAFYHRLGLAFEGFRRYLSRQHRNGRRVHVVAEPDLARGAGPGTAMDRVSAFLPYEAVCNEAYAGYGCPVTCVWDSRRHPAAVIDEVRRVHNHEFGESGPVPNAGFVTPADYLAGAGRALPEPPVTADLTVELTGAGDLARLRTALDVWCRRHGFAAAATADIVVAVSEVATNGLLHGGTPVLASGWRHGMTLVVQVDDCGGRSVPPSAGYLPPRGVKDLGGRGLWLARQLADAVTTYTAGSRTTVRLYFPHELMHLPPPAGERPGWPAG